MEEKLKIEHLVLKEEIIKFLKGDLSAADLKHSTAPFGIYQQRDDLFMTRIRIAGGHLAVSEMRAIANIIENNNIGYAHLTTRQDIQFQGVPAENVYTTVRECTEKGLPFKGGGGNTFRNIAVNPDSGISQDCIFDVMPHAKSLTEIIFTWDKAYELPRKLKIGFASSPKYELLAATQDLGFVAAIKDGKQGFKVYGAGGMGRESTLGVKLFDFIPVEEVPRCALAMTELFYDHGDRDNRNKARIRFIAKRLGSEKFIELFNEYFDKTSLKIEGFPAWKLELKQSANTFPEKNVDENWLKYAVNPTCFGDDIVSVRLFVPGGNLTAEQLKRIVDLSDICGISFVRLTAGQDILLPLVHRSALAEIYNFLKTELNDIDLTLESFKGHITSCIGATVCKIGILDSQAMANAVAVRLDQEDIKAEAYPKILDMVKISGCPNSCSGHPAACIGLQGQKKKLEGKAENVYKIFLKDDDNELVLAQAEDYLVKEDNIPERILELIKERL